MRKPLLHLRSRRGVAVVLTAFMMTGLLISVGFAVDMSRMYLYRNELQTAADAAALAGAKDIMDGLYGSASADVSTYAGKYAIEGDTLSPYSTIPGTWTKAGGFVATAGGSWTSANAVRDSVRHTAPFTFGRLFGLTPKTLHAGADAIVGSVGATSCIRPLAVPYQSLLQQLYNQGFHSTLQNAATYSLADSDVAALKTSTQVVQLKVTDASDSPINGSFYLLEMGPYAPAAGTPLYSPGPTWGGNGNSVNGSFPDRFAGDCSNSTWTVTLGDWMEGKQGNVNGPMESAFDQMCGTHITGNNNTYYCTVPLAQRSIKVVMWATQNSSICSPRCFQAKYLGEFVIDHYTNSGGNSSNGGDGLFGYFKAAASDGTITAAASGTTGGTLLKLALVK